MPAEVDLDGRCEPANVGAGLSGAYELGRLGKPVLDCDFLKQRVLEPGIELYYRGGIAAEHTLRERIHPVYGKIHVTSGAAGCWNSKPEPTLVLAQKPARVLNGALPARCCARALGSMFAAEAGEGSGIGLRLEVGVPLSRPWDRRHWSAFVPTGAQLSSVAKGARGARAPGPAGRPAF
jgi:hypothetical protein